MKNILIVGFLIICFVGLLTGFIYLGMRLGTPSETFDDSRFQRTSKQSMMINGLQGSVSVLRDSKTEKEYLVVVTPHGLSVTPLEK